MKAPSSTITGRAPGRLEHAADADAARRGGRPAPIWAPEPTVAQVSTIVFGPDPGADVHVRRHQDHAAREERAVARDRRRDDADAELLVARLERDLVVVLERPDLARLHLARAEVVEDRRLHVLVDDPVVTGRLGDADLAAVERGDRLVGRHSAASRIAAARSHSSWVGTSAILT